MTLFVFDIDDLPDNAIISALRSFPEDIAGYIDSYRSNDDKKRRLLARLLVQFYFTGLSRPWDWGRFKKDERGKPYLENGPYLSISHSGKKVVVVFDDEKQIGIDIQEIKEVNRQDVSLFLHEDEIAYLKGVNFELKAFIALWAKKEAFLKACGAGLLDGLDKISVLHDPVQFGTTWHFMDVTVADGYACVICSGSITQIIEVDHVTIERIRHLVPW